MLSGSSQQNLKTQFHPSHDGNRELPIGQEEKTYWKFPIASDRLKAMDEYRHNLLKLIESRDPPTDLKNASEAIGRNHAYLHQFIYKGTPKRLNEEDRIKLAKFLRVEEKELLAPTQIASLTALASVDEGDVIRVPVYDVRASAGHGALVERENILYHISFRSDWIRSITRAAPEDLAVVSIMGDSMEPTLSPDDTVLVDTTKRYPRQDGIYVLAYDGALLAKRVRIDPVRKIARIISDNPSYDPVDGLKPEEIHVFGQVIWLGRRV